MGYKERTSQQPEATKMEKETLNSILKSHFGVDGDFQSSLDAVATLEAKLTDEEWNAYAVLLGSKVIPTGWRYWRDTRLLLSASAEQRCRALVATISLDK